MRRGRGLRRDGARGATRGAAIDVVVSSVGRDLFGRMIELLRPGRPARVLRGHQRLHAGRSWARGDRAARARCWPRAELRPHEGVLVYWRPSVAPAHGLGGGADAVGDEAIQAALRAGARVVAVTGTDAEAARLQARFPLRGAVSLETLARSPSFCWPDTMPDYDLDADGYRAYQEATLKPFGQAVGRLLATADNPRGYPDLIVERAGQDTLGVSAFIARPSRGPHRLPGGRGGTGASPSTRRTSGCTRSASSSRTSPSWAATSRTRTRRRRSCSSSTPAPSAFTRRPSMPGRSWPRANQAIHENRHTGTLTVRVGATDALDGARSARAGLRGVGLALPRHRDRARAARPGAARLPRAGGPRHDRRRRPPTPSAGGPWTISNACSIGWSAEPALRAVVLTGAGAMFVAGADIRQLRAFATAGGGRRTFAARAQRLFARIARLARAVRRPPSTATRWGAATSCRWPAPIAWPPRARRSASPRSTCTSSRDSAGRRCSRAWPCATRRRAARRCTRCSSQALTVLLDGRRRTAAEAHALGLVDEVAPADALSHALGIAGRIARGEFTGAALVAAQPARHRSPSPTSSATRRSSGCWPITSAFPGPGRPAPSSTSCAWAHAGHRGRARRGGARVRPARRLRRMGGPGSTASSPAARCRFPSARAGERAQRAGALAANHRWRVPAMPGRAS